MSCSSPETRDFMAKIGESVSDCGLMHMTVALWNQSSEMSGNDDHGGKPRSENDDVSGQRGTVHFLQEDPPGEAHTKIPASPGKETSTTEEDRLSRHGGISTRTRPPSLLEQGLLPEFRMGPSPFSFSTSLQLTIFYAGTVHVYDNVSFDKAQAIVLLAGKSSSPKCSFVPRSEETEKRIPISQPHLPSICKLEADLPVARKNSLRRFLEKRHHRITSKTPYAAAKSDHPPEVQATSRDAEAPSVNANSSLSPFPSRPRYFSPVPTARGSQ